MDTTDMLKSSGLSATAVMILLILYRVFSNIEGKRCVSKCCGHKYDAGFAVETMSSAKSESNLSNKLPVPAQAERQVATGSVSADFEANP